MFRYFRVGTAAAGLLVIPACGSPSAPTVTQAVITVTANPSSIAGAPCTGCGPGSTDLETVTTITIQETAGVAASVTQIEMTLRETGTAAVIASGSFDSGGITQLAGSNRVPARGRLDVRCGVHYAADAGGPDGRPDVYCASGRRGRPPDRPDTYRERDDMTAARSGRMRIGGAVASPRRDRYGF